MIETIKKLSEIFELMVFSDGLREVHNRILGKIDPENKYFSFKLYKDHCYMTDQGYFIKDLRVINRPFSSIVLVDNSTCSFGFQLSNGIPIIPFTGDKEDSELLLLGEYLLHLQDSVDVRQTNREMFKFPAYVGCQNLKEAYQKIFKSEN